MMTKPTAGATSETTCPSGWEMQLDPMVYVVTLTWNQKEDTLSCLESLTGIVYPCYRVLVVDNGSSDGTVEAIANSHPDVEVIVNAENLGFSGGFNIGIRYALEKGADFLFIVNNDTYVAPDILQILVSHSDDARIGMVAPIVYYAAEPQRIWSAGANRHPWTYEMMDKGDNQLDRGQWGGVVERDYLVGCALLLRRSMLMHIGLFDERFRPIYYEDMDLCVRARSAGYRLLLVSAAKLWHRVSASAGGSGTPRERYLMARHSVWFFRKHIRGWHWFAVVPFRIGSAIKTVIRLCWQRRYPSAVAYLRGLHDGLRLSPSV